MFQCSNIQLRYKNRSLTFSSKSCFVASEWKLCFECITQLPNFIRFVYFCIPQPIFSQYSANMINSLKGGNFYLAVIVLFPKISHLLWQTRCCEIQAKGEIIYKTPGRQKNEWLAVTTASARDIQRLGRYLCLSIFSWRIWSISFFSPHTRPQQA